MQSVEVDLAETVQGGPVAKLALERPLEVVEERALGQLATLEAEEGILAVALRHALHPMPELLRGDAGAVLKSSECLDQVVGEDAAEVADHGFDLQAVHARTSSW